MDDRGGGGTHYDALGLSPNCSADQIRDRYWELLSVVHPSASGDPYLFQTLTEAYSALADPPATAEKEEPVSRAGREGRSR